MPLTYYPPPGTGLRWMYVDFNSYFASVEQQLNPRLRNRPVAVMPVDTEATCAIAASYEAKAFGVKTGTPIYEARRLCPGLICVLARHERYVEYHHRILEEIDRHIPVTLVGSIDEVACQLMDNETSLEAVTRIAHSIKQGLAARVGEYIRCSIGVAPNRYLAKVATDLQKPDGFTILRTEDLPGRLLDLQLRDLPGIGRNMERRLHTAQIATMEALWALDARRMRKAWGSIWGERMWHLLRGADLPEEETTRRSIGHSHVMAPEYREPEKARYVARRLTLKAASRMRRMDYCATVLSFSARLETGTRFRDSETCLAAQDSLTFLHMLDAMWARALADSYGLRVKKVSVVLHGLVPASDIQPGLLDSLPEMGTRRLEKAKSVSLAIDRLNQRYGRDTVSLGLLPSQGRSFSGTKIAFTRIPEKEEFLE